MALKIALKPNEKLIIGGAVIANGKSKSEFVVENNIPILRERDIMRERDADTHCKKIYFVIQLMYIDEKNLVEHHNTYWKLVRRLLEASPRSTVYVEQMSSSILGGKYYQALKAAKKLIEYERGVIENAHISVRGI